MDNPTYTCVSRSVFLSLKYKGFGKTLNRVPKFINFYIMDKVRAKFVCSSVQDQPDFQSQNVALTAVIDGSEENKSFSKYTPAGNLNITISNNTQAFGFFAEGVEYYLDFTVAAISVD